jgi:uncharacterized membrane protein YkvA (DUF1232 family)
METRKSKNTERNVKAYFGNLVQKTSHYIKNPDELNHLLNEAFAKANVDSENKAIRKVSDMLQTLFRMTKASLSGEYKELSKGKMLLGVAAIAYIVSPKDLIPDKIPFIGLIDDMIVLSWLIKAANDEIIKFKAWEGTWFASRSGINPAY